MTLNKKRMVQVFDSIRRTAESRADAFKNDGVARIYIGKATCGIAAGALDTQRSFEEALKELGVHAAIRSVRCYGHCYAEPLVIVDHPEAGLPPVFYPNVTPGKARMIAKSFLLDGDPLFEYMLGALEPNDTVPSVMDYPRFKLEKRLVMERCGLIDPEDIFEYIAMGGYSSLIKAVLSSQREIIKEILLSGLRGRGGDIELLESLCADIKKGSLCGFGKIAPNPVLTSIKYFRDEYEAHIKEKRCPAGMCRDLTAFYIDLAKCSRGCNACARSCPVDAIFTTKERKKGIDRKICVKCGECASDRVPR